MMLLDVELGPGLDGFQIYSALRGNAHTVPIIMLTGRSAEADTVRGRVQSKPTRSSGALQMDLDRCTVSFDDRPVHLTFSEFQLLAALLERPGAVCSRADLMAAIWGDSTYRDLRGIDVHIRHLREKLEPGAIVTVRGGGYRLASEESDAAASS